jgi:hypothetical protein
MSFKKFAEIQLNESDIYSQSSALTNPLIMDKMADDSYYISEFKKLAEELKKVAPKANDFLYFSAIMMHAAEASLVDGEGNLKKDASGKEVSSNWEKNDKGSWKWSCTDGSIQPYKNSNNDIFPEEELIKAYKKWVGRPLCLDHKSSSVDMIRGVIVDTVYDAKHKRVIALCALDKKNYPDLARKVSTGYATCVSMGTAVGKAICTDCGKVARVEPDFCEHMRRKSCYGEINVDLSPIELSIVVNGADPQAKIRYIVAAKNSIASYLLQKEAQLSKLAEDETRDIELCTEVTEGLGQIGSLVLSLQEKIDQLKGNEEAEQERHESSQDNVATPEVTTAQTEAETVKTAAPILAQILDRIDQLDSKFNKLSLHTNEDSQMTTKQGYFLGGGGPNEPAPGAVKYEKEDSDSIRNNQDKQMTSAVDTGPVDGLFPGDEQKKRELLRLAQREEERKAALAAAKEVLNKSSYMQGGGGPNEPTPGKVKYTKENAESIREKDDTQMHAPSLGKIDGLANKDLETKKKLLRAKLQARFVKAANPDGSLNQGDSRWDVYANKNLIFSATVNEISGKRADAMYSGVATTEFGAGLIQSLKSEGFEKVVALYKGAQMAQMAPMAPSPADPMAGLGAPSAPAAAAPVGDEGNAGTPQEQLTELSQELTNLAADLAEVEQALSQKSDDLADMDELSAQPTVTAETKKLLEMQKKLSEALRAGVKHTSEEISDHLEEIALAQIIAADTSLMKSASSEKKKTFDAISRDACRDAKRTIADTYKLLGSFVKYARGTETLSKRASKEIKMNKAAQVTMPADTVTATPPAAPKPAAPVVHTLEQGGGPGAGTVKVHEGTVPKSHSQVLQDEMAGLMPDLVPDMATPAPAAPLKLHDALRQQYGDGAKADDKSKDKDAKDEKDAEKDKNDVKVDLKTQTAELTPEEYKATKAAASDLDLSTKEGRAAFRAKLAEKGGIPASDMPGKAHGKGGFTTQLDVKPTGDLAKVETLDEVQKAMHDVANAPPKVRKMAEQIQSYVVAGRINPETDFDGLIAQGLDGDAVAYWKKFYGQAKEGGSQFAAELVKEHQAAKLAEEKESYKVKVARAYALAHDMADRDMIGRDASTINTQVNDMLDWSDKQYESVQRLVNRQAITRKAAAMPEAMLQVGTQSLVLPAPEAAPSDLRAAFESVFANKKY